LTLPLVSAMLSIGSDFQLIHIPGDAADVRHCMKRAFIAVFLIGLSQPVVAQSIFDGFGQPDRPPDCMVAPEHKMWRSVVIRQLRERLPKLNLGRGSVTMQFYVDYAGRVTRLSFSKYDSNAQALVAASMIAALKLPPPPSSLESECRRFSQTFRFH
jgi:hypothetical protein